jgi:DNA mismatch endonuclease, patch repair protein
MSRIRGRNTRPELRLRKALWALGLRYTLESRLPGKPDLVFPRYRTVLFLDGCFWHLCGKHAVLPQSNSDFWRNKLQENVARDRRVNRELRSLGWRVIRVWEHEVGPSLDSVALRLSVRIRKSGRI